MPKENRMPENTTSPTETRSTATTGVENFLPALCERIDRLGSRLTVGIDPNLDRFPEEFQGMDPEDAIVRFAEGVLEATEEIAVAVKPQVAFFERFGWRGVRALETVCRSAASRGFVVILDAKRGDIGSTAQAYAEACLGDSDLGRSVHALTVNPYLGTDSLEPFFDVARARRKGLFVLARTSNPGGAEFQSREGDSTPVYLSVARAAAGWSEKLGGEHAEFGGVGLVAGATFPEELAAIREAAPRSWLLLPGIGAQGGDVNALRPAWDSRGYGGLVSSSRAVLYAHQKDESGARWQDSVASAAAATRDEIERARGA